MATPIIVPEPSLRDRIADIILGQDTMVLEGAAPREDALGLADALIAAGVTIASWEYTTEVQVPVTGWSLSTSDPFPERPATHRRAKAGDWEPLPPGTEHMADSITFIPMEDS